jgi:hypothetical protein
VHINIKFNFKIKFKENPKYMLIIMFMFDTHVIYYFYVDHYKISNIDA